MLNNQSQVRKFLDVCWVKPKSKIFQVVLCFSVLPQLARNTPWGSKGWCKWEKSERLLLHPRAILSQSFLSEQRRRLFSTYFQTMSHDNHSPKKLHESKRIQNYVQTSFEAGNIFSRDSNISWKKLVSRLLSWLNRRLSFPARSLSEFN